MSDITHILLTRIVDLFTFSHGGNWNKQGGHVTFMWLTALSSVILCFDVAMRYFEVILKNNNNMYKNKNKQIELINHMKDSAMLVECE